MTNQDKETAQPGEPTQKRATWKTVLVFSMLFAVLGAVVVFGFLSTFSRPVTTVIITRHAEKKIEPNNNDPDLSPAGEARAKEIARMFANAGVNAIYATQYKRTQQTVKPLSDAVGVPVTQVGSRNMTELLAQIRGPHRGQVVFIAGHNNTVPEIVAALGGPTYPTIPETEYDNLFVVTVYRTGKAKVVKMKYGAAALNSGQ